MPRQLRGLEFDDRIASLPGGGYVFRCQRRGHDEVVVIESLLRDARDRRTDHDAECHLGRRPAGLSTKLTLGQALDDFVAYYRELESVGKRDSKTIKFYNDAALRLRSGFGSGRLLLSIDRNAVRVYILHRLRSSFSQGSRIVKELKVLQKIAADRSVPLEWKAKDFVDEIRPVSRKKRVVSTDEMARFIAALSSDARDFSFTKLRTVLRNEELYDLRVESVDLKARVIRYIDRAKRKTRERVQVISDDLFPVLERRCADKLGSAFVFTHKGRKIQQSTFRKECLRASRDAGIDPPISSLGFIRHNVLTRLRQALGLEDASSFAGHSTVSTIEHYYDLDTEKIDAKRRASDANVKAFPVKTG